jgi:hypothetical protein
MAGVSRHGHTAGDTWSSTYRSWMSMRDRCRNPKSTGYARYGGAGVTVCERWEVFENFLADMGERPAGTSIGRYNDVGNYEPGNCAWQTRREQAKRGGSNGRARLTEEQVACARALHKPKARRGCSTKNMAADLGIAFVTLDEILRYKTWRHI